MSLWRRCFADRPREQRLVLAAVAALTVIGAIIRAIGFSSLGLFRDDAWVSLSARTGLGTAWHMWVTAPGFFFLERTFILLGPNATWWDQIPPYLLGVLGVPAAYVVVRYFRFDRMAALIAALLVCVSPICVVYSTRVKEYSVDFLTVCVLLVVAERARRSKGRRELISCAVVSVGAFLVSASTAIVIIGVWAVLGICGLAQRSARTRTVLLGATATGGCLVVALIFYGHISPTLNRFWVENAGFINHSSPSQFISTLFDSTWSLLNGLFGFPNLPAGARIIIIVLWLVLSVFGLVREQAMAIPALAVLLAVIASALHVLPLGTGRTDEYLYPALLLLPVAGGCRLAGASTGALVSRFRTLRRTALPVSLGLSLAASFALIGHAGAATPGYPGVAVQQLAAEIHQYEEPGDHIFVNESMRYPWALYESDPLRVELGGDWSTNFTVVSTAPSVFIDPSEDYENDQHPKQWAKEMNRYQRVWYVWSPPLSVFTFSWGALMGDGWHVVRTVSAPGCTAYLLVRGNDEEGPPTGAGQTP